MEDERTIGSVEDPRRQRAPEHDPPAFFSFLSKKIFADSLHRHRHERRGQTREEQLQQPRGQKRRAEDDAENREAVRVQGSRVVRVLLIPALPRFGRAVAFLPVEVRAVRGHVCPVPGRETGRPLDVRVLVRLHPEVPRRERRRGERHERGGAQREDEREHGEGRRDARADCTRESTRDSRGVSLFGDAAPAPPARRPPRFGACLDRTLHVLVCGRRDTLSGGGSSAARWLLRPGAGERGLPRSADAPDVPDVRRHRRLSPEGEDRRRRRAERDLCCRPHARAAPAKRSSGGHGNSSFVPLRLPSSPSPQHDFSELRRLGPPPVVLSFLYL